jgi:hypothetical protein
MRCRYLLLSVLTCAAASIAVAKDEPADRKQDEQAIRAASAQYLAALEKGDGKAALGFWASGGDIVDPSRRSRPANEVLAGLKPTSQDARPKAKITAATIRFLSADSAVEDGTSEVVHPGSTTPVRGHFSAMWVKQQGKWKLASLRETRAEPAPGSASPSAQLAALDWLTGNWVGESGDKTLEIAANWNSNHTYLVREMRVLSKGQVLLSANQRIGWDPKSQQIKAWTFDADGGHAEGTWTQQGNSWVARSVGTLPDGKQTSSTNSYTYDGKNAMIWKSTGARGGQSPNLQVKLARRSTASRPHAAPATASSGGQAPARTSDDPKKAEILNSARWRRAEFEFNEWLSSQPFYDKQQAERVRANFAATVEKSTAEQLQFMLDDMDAKFKIIDSKEAQETRAWMAQYLSILSDKRREEVMRTLPNLATMTASQLGKEVAKIEQQRANFEAAKAEDKSYQPPTTNPWDPGAKAAMQAYYSDHQAGQQYYSPYSPPGGTDKRPFSDVPVDQQDFHMYVGAYGGFGLIW